MHKLSGVAFALLTPLFLAAPALAADASIDRFEAAQAAAWNAHDAAAYSAAIDPDADVITSLGWRWHGQAEAARNLGDGFKLVYAQARLAIANVEVRALTSDLATVTLTWSIDGARTFHGEPATGARHGYQTQLLQRNGAGWTILAQQDTEITAPPPAAPQYASPEAIAPVARFPTTPPPVRRCILARANGDCLIYGKAKPTR